MLVELDQLENEAAFIKALDDVRRAYGIAEMLVVFKSASGPAFTEIMPIEKREEVVESLDSLFADVRRAYHST